MKMWTLIEQEEVQSWCLLNMQTVMLIIEIIYYNGGTSSGYAQVTKMISLPCFRFR